MGPRKSKEKVGVFQCSPDVKRIIPCQANYAYISTHLGKLLHLPRTSDAFVEACKETDQALGGRITQELTTLGWTEVLEAM